MLLISPVRLKLEGPSATFVSTPAGLAAVEAMKIDNEVRAVAYLRGQLGDDAGPNPARCLEVYPANHGAWKAIAESADRSEVAAKAGNLGAVEIYAHSSGLRQFPHNHTIGYYMNLSELNAVTPGFTA